MEARRFSEPIRLVTIGLEWAAGAMLLFVLLDLLLQVAGRFFPGGAPAWTSEAIRLGLVWISLIGAAAASFRREHLVIDSFPNLSPRVRRVWDVLISIFIIVVSAMLCYGAAVLTWLTWSDVMPSLGWPVGMFYVPLVISAAMIIIWELICLFGVAPPISRLEDSFEQIPLE